MIVVLRQRCFMKFCRRLAVVPEYSNSRNLSQAFVSLKPAPTTLKTICIGFGLGGLTGAIYVGYKNYYASLHGNVLEQVNYVTPLVLKSFPDVKISRQIVIPEDNSGLKLTLFQYPTCPFCCKVRAFLDYFGVSYNVVEVNPVLRQQIKWSQYKKVPILLVETDEGYQQLYDSSMIMSALSSYLADKSVPISEITQNYPTVTYDERGKQKTEVSNRYFITHNWDLKESEMDQLQDERKWRMWADNVLVHTLSPNVYRTLEESKQSFRWFAEVGEWHKLFPAWETALIIYAGSYAMWMISKKLKKRHNLKPDVRTSLYDECEKITKEIKNRKSKFLGGDKPNLSDLSIYGVLSSIEGCAAFKDLLENTNIGIWYSEMSSQVRNHNGIALTR